jgi:hypothetical protein
MRTADMLARARACRTAVTAYLVAAVGDPEGAADLRAIAMELAQAAQHLERTAQDPELHAWLAHRAAGGVIILKQADRSGAVVVGDAQGHAPQVQPVEVLPWWKRRFARRAA